MPKRVNTLTSHAQQHLQFSGQISGVRTMPSDIEKIIPWKL